MGAVIFVIMSECKSMKPFFFTFTEKRTSRIIQFPVDMVHIIQFICPSIAFVTSERLLTKSHVDITQCRHENLFYIFLLKKYNFFPY